jgi:hypothetical protein
MHPWQRHPFTDICTIRTHLPLDGVLEALVVHADGQVAALIEAPEGGVGRIGALLKRTSLGRAGQAAGRLAARTARAA